MPLPSQPHRLLQSWERFAAALAAGFEDDLARFRAELDVRRDLEAALLDGDAVLDAAFHQRLQHADERVRQRCAPCSASPTPDPVGRGGPATPTADWWYFIVPRSGPLAQRLGHA